MQAAAPLLDHDGESFVYKIQAEIFHAWQSNWRMCVQAERETWSKKRKQQKKTKRKALAGQ